MPPRPVTPPARALPRTVARSFVGSNSWTAILETPSGNFHGSLRKPTAQFDPHVTHINVSCDMPNLNDKDIGFPSCMTIRFGVPFISDTEPGGLETHPVTVKIFAEGFRTLIISSVNDEVTAPTYITEMSDYVRGRTQLTKVRMVLNPKGIICDGLFIDAPFPDAAALETMSALKTLFKLDHMTLNLWVRSDRNTPFAGPIDRLLVRQFKDTQDRFFEKFYTNDQSFAIFDEMTSTAERPVVLYQPALPVSLNITEMLTKYAVGVIELNEFQQASAKEFNGTIFDMKVFTLESGGTKMYFGLLKPQKDIALTPREGEKLTITFNQDGMPNNEQWQAKVLAPFKHYLSSYISIHLYRPRQAHPPDAVAYVREHVILDFVETVLGSGELEGLDDEEIFEDVIKNTPTFTVKASVKLSETTARRQILAIEALQRGCRYNIRKNPHELIYRPWSEDKDIQAFGEFLLLQNSIPQSRTNWLGAGIAHVQHLTDDDQLDAIQNLFCNAPSPVGVLVGPAGTGKTFFMATMITAHVLAHGSKHIVGSPSNVGAEVAAKTIGKFFKADPRLRGKIVMRAYHDGPENSQVPRSDGANSRSPNPDQQANAEVGLYSADGWYDTTNAETKKLSNELVNVIRKVTEIGNVDDPRMESFNQSLCYHMLCIVGYENFPENDFTRGYKVLGEEFTTYLRKIVKNGVDSLNAAQIRFLKQELDRLVTFTLRNTSVLCGTLTFLGHHLYAQEYKIIHTFWNDECGQASVPDWLNVIARYKFKQVFLLGDPNQLYPVVVGPSPLTGFMRSLEMSPIQLLLDAHWPSVTLTNNRRSAKGIIDIPSKLFYKGLVKAHPSSGDDGKHKWTAPVANLIREAFSTEVDSTNLSSVAYFSSSAPSGVDRLTFSSFNTKNQAFCLNFVEKCVVELGVAPQDIGYTSPYQAQCKRMALALRKLEAHYKTQGKSFVFSLIKCAPIDGYQGGSAKVMVGDFTSSEKLGFMSARGRNCVLLTRAEDFALYIGNKDIRAPRDETKNYPSMGFAMAGLDKVCHNLDVDHAWMSHQFA